MSKKNYPTPTIAAEEQFHCRNNEIYNAQANLTIGSALHYSDVLKFVKDIEFMRLKNRAFNTKHGLSKEIA